MAYPTSAHTQTNLSAAQLRQPVVRVALKDARRVPTVYALCAELQFMCVMYGKERYTFPRDAQASNKSYFTPRDSAKSLPHR